MQQTLSAATRDMLILEAAIFNAWHGRDAIKARKWAEQITDPARFPKLLWLRGMIALDCARGDYASAHGEWEQAKRLVEVLPRTKFRDCLLSSFEEWLVEITEREREASSRMEVAGAQLQE